MAPTPEPAGGWTLPEGTEAAAAARSLVAEVASGRDDLDDAILIASELSANAVRHGCAPIELRAHVTGGTLRIEVTNRLAGGEESAQRSAAAITAAPSMPDPHADRGRGLAIVGQLASDWGWHVTEDSVTVWAELD